MSCSWVPATPAKPGTTRTEPICADWENDQSFANWLQSEKFSELSPIDQGFLQENPVACDLTNDFNTYRNFSTGEEEEGANSVVEGDHSCRYNSSVNDEDTWRNNVSFGELLALVDAAGTKAAANASTHTAFNAAISPLTPNFHANTDSSQMGIASENCSIANHDTLLGTNFPVECNSVANIPNDGSCAHSKPFFDLNFSPGTAEATVSKALSSQFSPITPEKTTRKDEKLESAMTNLSICERLSTKRVLLGGLYEKEEQYVLVDDQLCESTSTQLEENHKPDKEGTKDVGLKKTPPQKPRRKKHRPKVIVEGQSQLTPKPKIGKPSHPQEMTERKRKYVRKKGVNDPTTPTPHKRERNGIDTNTTPPSSKKATTGKRNCVRRKKVDKPETTSLDEENCEMTDPETVQRTRISCRRTLNFEGKVRDESPLCHLPSNFDIESQAQNYRVKDQSGPFMLFQQGRKARMEIDKLNDKNELVDKNACTRGKCQIVISDSTHDKEGNAEQVIMNLGAQSMQKSPGDSDCSSNAFLVKERQHRGLKRQLSDTTVEKEMDMSNSGGTFHGSLQSYCAIVPRIAYNYECTPGMNFPFIYKKKRTKRERNPVTSSMHSEVVASENRVIVTFDGVQLGKECFGTTQRVEKNRSAGISPLWNLPSLLKNCRKLRTSPGGRPTSSKTVQGSEVLHQRNRTIYKSSAQDPKALTADNSSVMNAKKRLTRHLLINSTVQNIHSQDEAQQHNAFTSYHINYREQHALVPYQRNGALVPIDSLFEPVKRSRPRPKVDLDDETNKVWKLLLENINSQGIDGTDEEKANWWEEERRVFQGRADSFIARMHLVQGDRRFSPWKGSVLDSVVGVFLTQNVSDHLSSSAFMSLAAQFPLESESNPGQSCQAKLSITVKEPEVLDLDTDTTSERNEVFNKPTSSKDSRMLQDNDYNNVTEVDNIIKSSRGSFQGTISNNFISAELSGFPTNGLDASGESALNKLAGCTEDERDLDDTLSSQNSIIYSQSSEDSSIAHSAEGKESSTSITLEVESGVGSKPNSIYCSTSIQKLSQMTMTILNGVHNQGNEDKLFNMDIQSKSVAPDSQNQNENQNNITCSEPTLCLIPCSGAKEIEHFDLPRENGKSSDITDAKEQFETELSKLSTESTTQSIIQKFMAISCKGQSFSCGKEHSNNYAPDVCQNVSKNTTGKLETEFQNQEKNYKVQEVSNIQPLAKNLMDITGSSYTDNPRKSEPKEVGSNLQDPHETVTEHKEKGERVRKEKQNRVDWDSLRKYAQEGGGERERTANTMDSVDWEAVRCADVNEIAQTIKDRGMNNVLAQRIKDFLNRLVRDHGSTDLEWLRDIPPDQAKEYLLSIRGLGLKSVECVRLLTLHHLAFPVDTNVGRIAVRLGWVPLQPLPESLQLHLLELYPVLETIQKYLWPRLCKLDQRTLYELHYQMITFGKVFCTKSKPNCNACPMRGECRHFASAFASARLALPAQEEKETPNEIGNNMADKINAMETINHYPLALPQANQYEAHTEIRNSEPVIEVPDTPAPIVELPATPEPDEVQVPECDVEDNFEDPYDIPTIQLNMEQFTQNLQEIMQKQMDVQEDDVSKALVPLTQEAASIPMPKLKNVNRLRTEHQVYELPDSHPLLQGMDKREADDPCSYLLAIWTPGETPESIQPPERQCSSQESGTLCSYETCLSCNSIREVNSQIVRGTILIPCRTAMRGSFPLNGTYFQVNEVFADHESSLNPVEVPRDWLWNLPRRTVYFGTSIPTIFKGLSTEGIQYCFWRGFVCVRGFDRKTRAPRPLVARLHFPASKISKQRSRTGDN